MMIVCNHLDDQAMSKLLMKSIHHKIVPVAHKIVPVAHKIVPVAHKSFRFSSIIDPIILLVKYKILISEQIIFISFGKIKDDCWSLVGHKFGQP